MSRKTLFILGSVLILSIIAAYYNSRNSGSRSAGYTPQRLTDFVIENTVKVEVLKDNKRVVLEKNDEGNWISVSSDNYRADVSKIQAMLLKLTDLKSSQMVTSNKNNYSGLGIGTADTISISLYDSSGKEVSGIDIGKTREAPKNSYSDPGRYVKPHLSDSVYLVSDDIGVDAEPASWLDTVIMKIEVKDITEIRFLNTSPEVAIVRTSDAEPDFGLKNIAEGDQVKTWMPAQTAKIFENLKFTDVLTAENAEKMMEFKQLVELDTAEGLKYVFSAAEKDKKFYLRIIVEIRTGEKEDAEKIDALGQKQEKFNSEYSKWAYALESYTAANFTRQYKDFIEVKQEKSSQRMASGARAAAMAAVSEEDSVNQAFEENAGE